MIYFTSDLHIGHKNIVRGISIWPSGYRDFDTLEEHNSTILKEINKIVNHDDELYILGDLSFNSHREIAKILDQINCNNIYFIIGNHDKSFIKRFNLHGQDMITQLAQTKPSYSKIKWVGYYKELEYNKTKIVLCHYPIASWNKMYKGALQLHGHSHARYTPNGKQLDVGIDSAYNYFKEWRPFSIDEVFKILSNKITQDVDHHNSETN